MVRELVQRGIPTRVLCRAQTSQAPFAGLNVDIVEGDLESVELLSRATQGCEAVIHCAAMIHIGWSRLEESRRANVVGTHHVLQACRAAGSRLIYVSTVDTLPAAPDIEHPIAEDAVAGIAKTRCAYVISKLEAEHHVAHAIDHEELDAAIIHPGFMLGPYDWKPSSGRMMLEVNRAPVVAAPPGGCSLCDARDVAAAIVNAISMATRSSHYIVAGENLTYRQMWTRMLEVAGRKKRVYGMGPIPRLYCRAVDSLNRWLPLREGEINGAALCMGSLNHYYDSSKAERELNYQRRPTQETLQDAWAWLTRDR